MSHEEKDINSEYIHKYGDRIDTITIKEGKVFLNIPILAKPKEIASDIDLVFLYATGYEGSAHVLAIKEGELFIDEYTFYKTDKEDNIKVLKLYIDVENISNKIHDTSKDKVKDALEASKIALDYLAKKGIAIFSREVMSIFRQYMIWSVEIESPKFTGVVIIKSRTGEVVKELSL